MPTFGNHWLLWPVNSLPWDPRLSLTLIAIVLPLLLTYITTTVQSYSVRLFKSGHVRPPPAPYWIPVLGNTASFALNTEKYLWSLLKRFGQTPFGLIIGPEKMYYIPCGEAIQNMFKLSREISSKPLALLALRDQFGVDPEDMRIFHNDDSGLNAKPAPQSEHMDPRKRILHVTHRDLHTYLVGASMNKMTAKFIELFTRRIEDNPEITEGGWTEMPDLYAFLQTDMFQSAIQSLCGEHLLKLCPDFPQQFWAADQGMLTYLRRLPRWMAPKKYATRDAAVTSVMKWRQFAADHFDAKDEKLAEAEWEPIWGSRLMRARAKMCAEAGVSARGSAQLDFGMIWATNANVIPATLWALLNIALSPNLTARVLAECDPCFDQTGAPDVAALSSKPLLTSIYMEALRFCAATSVARKPLKAGFRLGEWDLEPDATLISISWFGGHDAKFWNTGGSSSHHPVESFWAERFLEYPDDPASGPIRKPGVANASSGRERTAEDDKLAKPITTGIQAYWYPYGGGTNQCPGRFFAKQEMLAALAILVRAVEMELVDPEGARKTALDMKYFPVGALPPDRPIPVRVRRRAPREAM